MCVCGFMYDLHALWDTRKSYGTMENIYFANASVVGDGKLLFEEKINKFRDL